MVSEASSTLNVRDATQPDLVACARLDLSYETDYVWQVDARDESGAIALSFRTVRLPRMLHVDYPHSVTAIEKALQRGETFLVAEDSGLVHGYLIMRIDPERGSAWVSDLAIGRPWRRQRLGTALLQVAYRRAQDAHIERLTIETQTKNYPGICFCLKNGLAFCGFNDRYYTNRDIALFFGLGVRF